MVFVLVLLFAASEMVPGWEVFGLGWPPFAYYAVIGLAGALAGPLAMPGYAVPGVIAGPLCGIGALAAAAWYLSKVTEAHGLAVMIAAFIGALPSIFLFFTLKLIQDQFVPPPPEVFVDPLADDRNLGEIEEED